MTLNCLLICRTTTVMRKENTQHRDVFNTKGQRHLWNTAKQ